MRLTQVAPVRHLLTRDLPCPVLGNLGPKHIQRGFRKVAVVAVVLAQKRVGLAGDLADFSNLADDASSRILLVGFPARHHGLEEARVRRSKVHGVGEECLRHIVARDKHARHASVLGSELDKAVASWQGPPFLDQSWPGTLESMLRGEHPNLRESPLALHRNPRAFVGCDNGDHLAGWLKGLVPVSRFRAGPELVALRGQPWGRFGCLRAWANHRLPESLVVGKLDALERFGQVTG
mmetsp:Transcript_12972/g.41449  ORF Transcript_12972/g.41449 Transcript_12972/m.41449 type:complete len:236 (-) Transcript_12972:459-1166(-)